MGLPFVPEQLRPGLPLAKRIFILTGGIGCGKTAVAREFEALGIHVVDADVLSHELTAPGGHAIDAIRKALGEGVLNADGGLNRALVREKVFHNPDIRGQLEAILHPLIQRKAQAALAAAPGPYALYVVPLWLEKYGPQGSHKTLATITPEAVIVVDCPENLQIERVVARSGLSQNQVQAIMSTQVTRKQRLSLADHVIHNEGAPEALKPKVAALHRTLASS